MKSFWKSKTFWVGFLQLAAALSLFAFEFLSNNEITADPTKIMLLLNGLVMVILRWITSEPITSIAPGFDAMRPRTMKNRR